MAKVSIEQVSQHPEKFDWDEWRKQMEDIFKDITKPQPTPEPTPQPEEPPEQEEEPIEVIDDYFEVQSHISLLHKQGFKGKGIKVGVIDTGIAYKNHPAIKGKIIAGKNFTNDGRSSNDISSKHFHGQAVTSLVLAIAPQAEIVVAKVLDDKGSGDTGITTKGIKYCIEQGVDIINMSLGGGHDDEMEQAVREATDKGICVVVASGNESTGKPVESYPAAYDDSIAVGAIDANYNLADFSNFNNFIDVVAPGVKVKVADGQSDYSFANGTSFSAPIISGVLAVLKQKFINDFNRKPSDAELYGMLTYCCRFINNMDYNKQGHGFVDFKDLRNFNK